MARKICLAGDPFVGKTSLIRRFVLDQFSEDYSLTLGTKVTKKTVQVPRGDGMRPMGLLIWDIMGEPGFRKFLQDTYFHEAEAVVLVCDVTREKTLRALDRWWEVVEAVAGTVPVVVAANKVDLAETVEVPPEEVSSFAEARGWDLVRTSAKTGDGVEDTFQRIALRLVAVEPPAPYA